MSRSIITNNSSKSLYLGFIPPHGKTVPAGGSTTIDGDLTTILASGEHRYTRARELASLKHLIATGVVEVDKEGDSSSSTGDLV